MGLSVGVGVFLARPYVLPILILGFLSAVAGGFRARKRIYDERWGLLSYLGHTSGFWLGLLGSCLLIARVPGAAGVSAALGVALGVLAVLFAASGTLLFPTLVRARPLESPELEKLFAPVLEKAKCAPPALFLAEAPGGCWVNAFALPSLGRPGVLFTRGLLDALSPPETAAIFAHEVAHLEHYTWRRLAPGRRS